MGVFGKHHLISLCWLDHVPKIPRGPEDSSVANTLHSERSSGFVSLVSSGGTPSPLWSKGLFLCGGDRSSWPGVGGLSQEQLFFHRGNHSSFSRNQQALAWGFEDTCPGALAGVQPLVPWGGRTMSLQLW